LSKSTRSTFRPSGSTSAANAARASDIRSAFTRGRSTPNVWPVLGRAKAYTDSQSYRVRPDDRGRRPLRDQTRRAIGWSPTLVLGLPLDPLPGVGPPQPGHPLIDSCALQRAIMSSHPQAVASGSGEATGPPTRYSLQGRPTQSGDRGDIVRPRQAESCQSLTCWALRHRGGRSRRTRMQVVERKVSAGGGEIFDLDEFLS